MSNEKQNIKWPTPNESNLNDILKVAALVGDVEHLKQALDLGADPNAADASGDTPLHHALSGRNFSQTGVEIVEMLLKHKASPDTKNTLGSPLYYAAECLVYAQSDEAGKSSSADFNAYLDATTLLLGYGGNPSSKGFDGYGARDLLKALTGKEVREYLGNLLMLADEGSLKEKFMDANFTAAIKQRRTEMTSSMKIPTKNQDKLDQGLRGAVLDNQLTDAIHLLKSGADINARDDNKQSILHLMLNSKLDAKDKAVMTQFLIDNGADPNFSDKTGTPLFYAVTGIIDIAQDFNDAFAHKNGNGALGLREDHMHYLKIIDILLRYGANENIKASPDHMSPLDMISSSRNDELIEVYNQAKNTGNSKEKEKMATPNKAKPTTGEDEKDDIEKLVVILPKRAAKDVLADIDAMIGHDEFKREMRAMALRNHFDAARQKNDLPTAKRTQHTVYTGNPGVGKTTLARLKAELLYSLDLAGPKYAELSKERLVGKFIGHTEANVSRLLDLADQIFIDEAYNLASSKDKSKQDFGNKVVEVLIPNLENNREKQVVHFAGYSAEMADFLSSNPGLISRIAKFHHLKDFTTDQLGQIFDQRMEKSGYVSTPDAREYVVNELVFLKEKQGAREFGNGRIVRTMVEQVPDFMAIRLFEKDIAAPVDKTHLMTTLREDFQSLGLAASILASKNAAEKLNAGKPITGFKPMIAA